MGWLRVTHSQQTSLLLCAASASAPIDACLSFLFIRSGARCEILDPSTLGVAYTIAMACGMKESSTHEIFVFLVRNIDRLLHLFSGTRDGSDMFRTAGVLPSLL
jgi:hypothetical protein